MDIFSFFSLLGGLALFLFGMQYMGSGLEKASGGRLEQMLEKLTDSPIKGVFLGFVVTAVIQSSSATTVMVVGFVNSGIMKLRQAVGVIMGANIGTTVTAWILSLSGLEGDSVFVKMLKPESFSPLLALVGIIMLMVCKNSRKRDIGSILVGFTILMYGMSAMSSAVKPLADMPEFGELLLVFNNPVLGVLAGAVLTGIIQSSSASVGILQALSTTGMLPYSTAMPIIMGQNIGTCVTAMLSSIGAGRNAKRAACIHLYFNIIGTIIFLTGYYIIDAGDEAYILAKDCGAKFTEDTQEELDKRQASAALYSVMNETGLIYGALDKKSYIMTDTSGKYRADGKEFFYSAEYMRKKLAGEPLENFESYFEKISPEKFGDFEDYVITLDCSKQNQMLLQIENTRFATVSKYMFRNVDATDVPLAAQMRAYLESLTLSA